MPVSNTRPDIEVRFSLCNRAGQRVIRASRILMLVIDNRSVERLVNQNVADWKEGEVNIH